MPEGQVKKRDKSKEKQARFTQEQYDMLKRCSDKKDMTEWNEWRKANPDEEIYLEGANLYQARLTGICLAGAHLANANLNHAQLGNADLRNVRLTNANCRDAILSGVRLNQAELCGADLRHVQLGNADLQGADFRDANLRDANLVHAKLHGVRLAGSQLGGIGLEHSQLPNVHLENSNLRDINLKHANLRGAHLEGADLRGADVRLADLTDAHLEKADLQYTQLQEAKLSGAFLEGANLYGCNVEGTVFWQTHLQGAKFRMAILNGSTMVRRCDVDRDTDFDGVGLSNVRIDAGIKQLLQYNVRRLNWKKWYRGDSKTRLFRTVRQLVTSPICGFWWITDYGRSTGRIVGTFFVLALVFALIYWLCPRCVMVNGMVGDIRGFLHALYFSVVTMTTLGFGDIAANPDSWGGQVLLMVQVILGYVLLGALVTRFAVLFTAGGPAGKFASEEKGE
ncbi:MAG: pentapeptide repeat-containing protein [Planctomycetota bacterium]|jgi:uncharacterized protein YjbI with pentapeptide repeats